jgi:hypothetical protein
MEHGTRRTVHTRRRYLPGFLVTILWMIPAMGAMAIGGFFLAEHVLAKKFLKESKVQRERLQPVAILSPEEAAKMQKDRTSHVWEDGVRDSDVPRLAPTDDSTQGRANSRTRERRNQRPRTRPRTAPTDVMPSPDVPAPPDTGGDTPRPDPNPPAPENGAY